MTTPPLLDYSITTDPVPLQVDATGATITVVASNPGIYSNDAATNYVAVTQIVVDFGPPGSGGSALTDNAGAVTYAAPDGWSVDVTGLQFTFRPPTTGNQNRVFPSGGLTFLFSGIAVNATPGTAQASITETASSPGGTPPNFYPPQPEEPRNLMQGLGKFPANFSIQSFAASPEAVAPGGQTQLAWVATEIPNSTFSLVMTSQGQVVTITQHGNGSPLAATDTFPNSGKGDTRKLQIDGTSIFTLHVTFTQGGDVIQASDQVVVAVPPPTIDHFTATPATALGVGEAVTLSWATVAAQAVTITPPLDGLRTQATLAGSATVYPLDFTRYELTASGQGLNVSQTIVLFPLAPGWTTRTANAPWSVNQPPMLFALNDVFFLYPGDPGSINVPVYLSADGSHWQLGNPRTNLPERSGIACAANATTALAMGGAPRGGSAAQDVWATTNGIAWNQLAASAQWPARAGAGAVFFQNAFWIMGGSGSGYLNDVWTSPDGVTWTQKSGGAAWSARAGMSLALIGGTLYLFGGQGAGGYCSDLWYTNDGVSWTQYQVSPFGGGAPVARRDAQLYGLSDRLMLFGGTGADGAQGDAWLWSSADGWATTNAPPVPWGATNFAGLDYNGGSWLMGGSHGVDFGKGVWVFGE